MGDPGPPDIWSSNPTNETHDYRHRLEHFVTARDIVFVEFGGKNTTAQLFNIANDEREMTDLAKTQPEEVSYNNHVIYDFAVWLL